MQAIFSPFAGRLSDRIEPRIVASIGMALTVVGLSPFTLLYEKTTLDFIVASLILLGFGFALFSSPNANAVMSSVEKRFYGVASAALGTMRLTGQMLSMGIRARAWVHGGVGARVEEEDPNRTFITSITTSLFKNEGETGFKAAR